MANNDSKSTRYKRQNFSSGAPWENIVGYSRAVRVGNTVEVADRCKHERCVPLLFLILTLLSTSISSAQITWSSANLISRNTAEVGVADFDQDGNPDIAVCGDEQGYWYFLIKAWVRLLLAKLGAMWKSISSKLGSL